MFPTGIGLGVTYSAPTGGVGGAANVLLLETADGILLETGSYLLLEN